MQDDTSRGGLGPRGREALIPTSGGSPFDCIRRVTPEGREFWSARDLMPLLGYEKWERFADAITRAKISARNAGYDPAEQFPGAGKLVPTSNGAQRRIDDYHLSRYACYLIEVMAAYQYGRHSLSPDRVHVSTLIERLPRPIPTDHGPSDPVIRVGGVWRRTSDIESSELVAALRVCPSMADTRVMPVISSEPVAVIC